MLNTIPTAQLFDALVSKLIINLKDKEELCPNCKGLRLTYRESDGKGFIQTCERCYNGKVYRCEYCNLLGKTSQCSCKQAQDKRREEFNKREWDKRQEALKTATVIPISKYDGYLTSLENEERVVEADEFSEQYLDNFDAELSPKYVNASIGEVAFSLDIQDIISDKSEDGYDEMYERLDMNSPLLSEVQVLLDKWVDENSSAMKVYMETNDIIVDLTELYEEGLKNNG